MEEKFNETIEGHELDEEQSAFVENLMHMLDEVREMAEEGYSPTDIVEAVKPQRQPG